ncbi:MAG: hypothetical protein M3Q33_06250 [Acidobacteriota bacterium]|nr:hypothetical protein [Acidobacteriota bacterium]
MNIQTRTFGENQIIISATDLQKLVEMAQKVEPIEIEIEEADFQTKDLMRLAENNCAFDFLRDEREDIYTLDDLKVRYK